MGPGETGSLKVDFGMALLVLRGSLLTLGRAGRLLGGQGPAFGQLAGLQESREDAGVAFMTSMWRSKPPFM